jgi:GNAT superfamily N-acetyltransferase
MGESPEVSFQVVDAASPEAGSALAQYFAELDQRFTDGFDRGAALAEATTAFDPPAGLFVVAWLGEDLVGCGGIQWLDERTGEIRRMWVDPARRGLGLGKRLLAHLELEVRSSGRSRVVLDTNQSLTEARAMYAAVGYTTIERYNDNPYAHHWFAKAL